MSYRQAYRASLCSYPTYEEWKQDWSLTEDLNLRSSYPTYEEWKPNTTDNVSVLNESSYPTYEEWKL